MTKDVWINLPTKDQAKAKKFYSSIGFTINENRSNPSMLAMSAGTKPVHIMIFDESIFKSWIPNEVTDTSKSTEVLISFDAETREEVDEMVKKVEEGGGKMYMPPADNQGWMYGCAFSDPDGHRWNILYMDMEKMPK